MRHEPLGVDAVAMETAADLIVHSAVGHVIQSGRDDIQRATRRGGGANAAEYAQVIDGGNLGAAPNPP